MRSRPVPVTVAAILLALCSLLSLPGPLSPGSEGVPEVVLYSGIVLGIVGLARRRRFMDRFCFRYWLDMFSSFGHVCSRRGRG
jgi:hypothetical protein